MGASSFRIQTIAERPDLPDLSDEIAEQVWPRFMLEDPVADRLWHHLYEDFSAYQFLLVDAADEVVAIGNCLTFHWPRPFTELPEGGWDWVFQRAVEDHQAGKLPNAACALQIMVLPNQQGKGISRQAVKAMRQLVAGNGLTDLVAPVRPSLKSNYPLTSIDRYIQWEMTDGLPFDPWLRVHARLGALMLNPCHNSMLIEGSVAEWEDWAGIRFPDSGRYVVEGALEPVEVDIERDLVRYVEPNVWMHHHLQETE